MSKPIAVLISDVHYNLQNLKLADAAMRMAIDKANELAVLLIVAGDLHDTKANLRGECVNAMVNTFQRLRLKALVLVGNHDKINEKSEDNSLGFLEAYTNGIVSKPQKFNIETDDGDVNLGYLIPYYHDADELRAYLKTIPKGSTLIMHQGLNGSNMGDYFQDKSALNHEDVQDFRVISGHYHARQDIKTGRPRKGAVGLFSYIGNPFTVSYGEANDPPKGFQVLMDDGTLEFVPTNLRKHVVLDFQVTDIPSTGIGSLNHDNGDLLWLRIHGTHEQLARFNRGLVAKDIGLTTFKLDLIPLDTKSDRVVTKTVTNTALFEQLIDSLTNTSDERKLRLKELYKHLGS